MGGPKTFLGFQVRSHVSEVQLLLQRADFALRLHCLDPVVALGRVKSCPLIYSLNFYKSFVGNGHSELGFTQTYPTLYSYWQIIFWKKAPIATKSKFLITKRLGGSLVLVPRLPSTSPLSPSSSWRNAIQLCDFVSTRYSAPCPHVSTKREQKEDYSGSQIHLLLDFG